MYTYIDFEYHSHISTTLNLLNIKLTNIKWLHMLGEEISAEELIHICTSESVALVAKFN